MYVCMYVFMHLNFSVNITVQFVPQLLTLAPAFHFVPLLRFNW